MVHLQFCHVNASLAHLNTSDEVPEQKRVSSQTRQTLLVQTCQHFSSGTWWHFWMGSSQHFSEGSFQHLVLGTCQNISRG